jgi:hypothetical protein
MRKILIACNATLLMIFFGCTNTDENREQIPDSTKPGLSADTGIKESSVVDRNSIPDTGVLTVPKDTATVPSNPVDVSPVSINVGFPGTNRQVLRGKIETNGPDVIYNLTIDNAKGLSAILSPDIIGCNIRFNRVTLPGGKSDGPFGKELKIELKEKGKYQVHVGHNRMAANLGACDYTIRFILSE